MSNWKNWGTVLITVGIFIVLKYFTLVLLMVLNEGLLSSGIATLSNPELSGITTLISSIFTLIVLFFWRPLKEVTDKWKSLSFWFVIACLVLGFLGLGINSFILSTLISDLTSSYESSLPILSSGVLGIFAVVVLVPITEEVVFRRVIIGSLSQSMHPYIAILISAILFGVLHGEAVQMLGATIIGLIFGWIYYQSKSLLPSTLLHIFNNGSFLIGLQTYKKEGPSALVETDWSFTFHNPYGIYLFFATLILFVLVAWWVKKKSLLIL